MTFITDPSFGPLVTFILISFSISLCVTLVSKFTTNQPLMKQFREDIKKYQDQIRKTKEPDKALAIQKKAMDVNMKYMSHSMKPTLFTLIPILIVFGWVAANLTVQQIIPNEPFNVTVLLANGNASDIKASASEGMKILSQTSNGLSSNYTLTAPEGRYLMNFSLDSHMVQKRVLVTNKWDFERPKIEKDGFLNGIFSGSFDSTTRIPSESPFKSVLTHHKPLRPFGSFSILGYMPGWLMTYILFSLIFTMALRKILDVN
ncbi:MAG: DUF106 domain-containing protein [Nanoarchaeota archaeon]|nr:MAG: DUF106 domain-containing protein [Nanoarchaeota archaeon]